MKHFVCKNQYPISVRQIMLNKQIKHEYEQFALFMMYYIRMFQKIFQFF